MIQIGVFSKITGISIDRLRNYDHKGLLVPVLVDENNGYRYYSESQIMEANQIEILLAMGFQLKEIKVITSLSQEPLLKLIQQKKVEVENKIEELRKQSAYMAYAIKDLYGNNKLALSVNVKTIPKRKLVTLRGIIHEFEEEGILWEKLDKEAKKCHIQFVNTMCSYACTHHIDREAKKIDTEVQKEVKELQTDTVNLKFIEVSEMLVASIVFKGAYAYISDIYAYVEQWSKTLGYKLCGTPFLIYYVSPASDSNVDHYISEMCFPIKVD